MRRLPDRGPMADSWGLDRGRVFLNHGSFGATPIPVREARRSLLERMEADPVSFLLRDYLPSLPETLARMERLAGARPGSVALVPNATTGVSTVLANVPLSPGDDVLHTGQEYFASRNALRVSAARAGARVDVVPLDLPLTGPEQVVDAVMGRVTPRTRLLLVDHVSSPTGMVMPVGRLVEELSPLGVRVLVDGAHGPGMLELDLEALGADYYTGNCHKWLCAPKTSAILHVREDRMEGFRPAVVSHLHGDLATRLSPFQVEFAWNGTLDPTPRMVLPETLDFLEAAHRDGLPGFMGRNRALALEAGRMLTRETGLPPAAPDGMTGSMYALRLPLRGRVPLPDRIEWADPLQRWLLEERYVQVPVIYTSRPPGRFLRISAMPYNCMDQYAYLAECLREAPRGLLEG